MAQQREKDGGAEVLKDVHHDQRHQAARPEVDRRETQPHHSDGDDAVRALIAVPQEKS